MRYSEALREEVSKEIRKFLQVPHLREYRQETDDESPIRLHFTVGKYRPNVSDTDLETLTETLEHSARELGRSPAHARVQALPRAQRERRALDARRSTSRPRPRAQEIWLRYGLAVPRVVQGHARRPRSRCSTSG